LGFEAYLLRVQKVSKNKIITFRKLSNSYFFCSVDHFEPGWKNYGFAIETKRIKTWVEKYPKIAKRHVDCEGKNPVYTFFYPQEEYNKDHLNRLSEIRHKGYGEVEIHLHHDNDTAEGLRDKLMYFKEVLHRDHGLLSVDKLTKKDKVCFYSR